MRINWTWVARAHVIWNEDLAYFTLWLFGRRFHTCWERSR